MIEKTLEEEVREFAKEWCKVNGKNSRHVRIQFTADFVTAREWKIGGFRSATATARDKEIEELREKLVQQAHDHRAQVVFWGDNADERSKLIAELRARVKELEDNEYNPFKGDL